MGALTNSLIKEDIYSNLCFQNLILEADEDDKLEGAEIRRK